MSPGDGWSRMFASAFEQSRNAMLLTDARRTIVDANPAVTVLLGRRREALIGQPVSVLVVGGPLASPEDWESSMAAGRFTGDAELVRADGTAVAVQWAASVETVTGRRLVLFVATSVSRWGARFRRSLEPAPDPRPLTRREREIVHLVSLGAAGPEIADELFISHDTVRTHIRNAMDKVGARSRAHLVAKALADGHAFG